MKCDIIIPVYNAYEYVGKCIESVLKNTDFNANRLILINDKSSDERILPLLKKYKKENPKKIVLLENENNLGFVRTVNKGMKYSDNDVLLLNSDTEVTKGWLAKIKECAYSDSLIATVTPLSNNATLASVPEIFKNNVLPENITIKEMGEIVEKCSYKDYPEIPTAHGFCMFIKREALEKVGYFDEKTFGKGYGEEVDFCFRCYNFGYKHVLCDNAYVFHKESQSFLDTKVDHSKLLRKKHPDADLNLEKWCRCPGIGYIGKNVTIELRSGKPNILVIVHDFCDYAKNIGGTTIHVLDLIRELREDYNFHVFYPDGEVYKVHSYFGEMDFVSSVYRRPLKVANVNFYSREYKKILEDIVKKYNIAFAHVHHIIGHYFDFVDVFKESKIEYVVSLHDFYFIYPEISKLSLRVDDTLKNDYDLEMWRSGCSEALRGASMIVAPSADTRRIYNEIYSDIEIKVIEHGVNLKRKHARHINKPVTEIAFVGGIGKHKGSKFFRSLTKDSQEYDYNVHLFGVVDDSGSGDFIDHGIYAKKDLPKLLRENNIGLVCALSIYPETYSYVASECIASGVPIVSFDMGAVMERIEKYNLGWIIEYTENTNKVSEEIVKILGDVDGYNDVIDSINDYKLKSVGEMTKEYDEIYRGLLKDGARNEGVDIKKELKEIEFIDLYARASNGVDYDKLSEEFGKLQKEYDKLNGMYNAVMNSARWNLISKIKIPKFLLKNK